MKQQKRKFLTLALASLLGAATFGGGVISAMADDATDAPTPATYSVSDVFTTSSATSDTTGAIASFSIKDGGTVTLAQRSLAWKWFAKDGNDVKAQYLNFELTFADANFESVSVNLETAATAANKDNKAVNVLKFVNVEGTVYALVNPAEDTDPATVGVAVDVLPDGTTEKTVKVTVNETWSADEEDTYGKYNVVVNDGSDKTVGKFENVGATYGKYASATSSNPLTPFKIKAEILESTEENAPTATVVRLNSLNGQSFALTDSKITDNANPVLVVNNEITSYMLGTTVSISDEFNYVDVLDKTVTKTVKYAQYNPTVEDADMEYKDLTSSIYFSDTQYEEAGVKKTVYADFNGGGKEYLSVVFKLSDEYHKEVEYDLSWYVKAGEAESVANSEKTYVRLDRNTDGATYTFIAAKNGSNEYTANANDLIEAYQSLVTDAAKDLKANSNTNFYLPSMHGLIADNGGYSNLKFTISYKSTNSTSASTRSSLTSSNLQFPVSKSGDYGFKVFAVDKGGNSMMYYNEDGELVKVASGNVWEIEEIPFFTFSIPEPSLSVDDNESKDTDRKDTVALGETYDDFDLTVLGDHASSARLDAKLYRVDSEKFVKTFGKSLATSKLSSITYAKIVENVSAEDYAAATDYEKLYFESYVSLVAKAVEVDAAQLIAANVFVEILPYDSDITEEDHAEEYAKNNVYNWNEENQTFVAQKESDVYFIFALYTASELDFSMVCGYKVITVDAEDDVLPGETDWLKNNVVSVILFGIAGLMLILIVVVLLIKPSDETLEDVEAKAAKKANKSKKEDNE